MKIRNGFVSNSSSSSFIVAFHHKPTSLEDLKLMMFGSMPGAISYDENTSLTYDEIVKVVYNDICTITKDKILKELSGKYICYVDDSISFYNRTLQDGATWYIDYDEYGVSLATDKNLRCKLVQLEKVVENLRKNNRDEEEKLLEKNVGIRVSYPTREKDDRTKYNEYQEKYIKYRDTKEFKEFTSNRWKNYNKIQEQIDVIRKQMAEKDYEVFINKLKSFDSTTDWFITIVEYSDNDGDFYSAMEHGNIFRNIPHFVISKH